ncbi:MAG: hypothetical protein BME93_05065 [Methanosarcinales archaeon Met12]|nr:MAG: hypothetical protein BME93_05065 [Methanosarcinales archaeon Met12]
MNKLQLEIDRLGHVVDLEPSRIQETLKSRECTFISHKFYNKGIYRVRNIETKSLEDFAIYIYRIESATYQGLVDELGAKCVDKSLWKNVPEGGATFFYAFRVEEQFIKDTKKSKDDMKKEIGWIQTQGT